jgi:hypothetical protein
LYDLAQRVAALDDGVGGSVGADISRLVKVMAQVVSYGTRPAGEAHRWQPADADRELEDCRLLARLQSAVPEIVVGPLAGSRQFWISAEKPSGLPPGNPVLDKEHFRTVEAAPQSYSTKPFHVGLYTSTGFAGAPQGMWRTYLDIETGSTIWRLWALTPRRDASVLEIVSAVDWCTFIDSAPAERAGLVYPDWQAATKKYDAIQMTARAIVAIQGFYFDVASGITAPTYWDVETTFWLRWRFTACDLVENPLRSY